MAAYIYIDPASGATTSKWTYSVWFKRTGLNGLAQSLLSATSSVGGGNTYTEITFNADDTLTFYNSDGGSGDGQLKTYAKYRDVGAWMHLVCVWDSANGTATDKMKMYINGVEPGFQTDSAPSGNTTIGNTYKHNIGAYDSNGDGSANTQYFLGDMSHSQMYNNAAYAATDFGSFDTTSGIWKIKTSGPSATYGTNGWFLKMEDRTNLDLDSSDNAYTFSTSGTLTATYDNPSNNFATWNSLGRWNADTGSLSNGNTTYAVSSYAYNVKSTLAMPAGKWYWEIKQDNITNRVGVCTANANPNSDTDAASFFWGDAGNGGVHVLLTTGSASWQRTNNDTSKIIDTYTTAIGSATDDIIMCALDVDSGKMYMGVNGTWVNSSDPAAGTGEVMTMTNSSPDPFVVITSFGTSAARVQDINFGNGYFGTDAVASANADDAGIGAFEYDVPTGFYALCTKNLKLQGG